jgi:hypothetical protein
VIDRDDHPIVIAAAGAPLVARLRRTFPARPWADPGAVTRRRGRILGGYGLDLVELPAVTGTGSTDAVVAGSGRSGGESASHRRNHTTDFVGEFAFMLGVLSHCRSLLLVIPGPKTLLADRIVPVPAGTVRPGEVGEGAPAGGPLATVDSAPKVGSRPREILPDILTWPETDGRQIPAGTVADPAVHAAADWASRRLAPHQLWVLALPVAETAPAADESGMHRLLHAVVTALGEQTQ